MQRNYILLGLLLILLSTLGVSFALAQSPEPDSVLVCVKKDGTMQAVGTADNCKAENEILLTMYTQVGANDRLAQIEARLAAVEARNVNLRVQSEKQGSRIWPRWRGR